MQGHSNDTRKVIRVFIASPGDLGEERRLFRDIIDEVNRSKANGMGIQLEPLGWEDTLPISGRPQELINEDVKRCDLMIMLLWKRWGTPTGEYSSGFEEEYELAKRLHETHGKPEIMLYFRKIPDDMLADPGEQLKKVLKFREKIESERRFLYKSYEGEDQWRRLFREHLSLWLDGLALDDLQTEASIEYQRRLKESEDEIRKIRAELETERQKSQTAIRALALKFGVEALEKADSGQITKAEECFAMSIANYPDPFIINHYGLFLERIGMLENAENMFWQVVKIGEETGDDLLAAIAYGNLGTLYAIRGDFDKAEKLYKKSLAINEELGRKEGMASDYKNLGYLYLTCGTLDKAEKLYKKSLAINEELGRKEGIASDYRNLGNLHVARNNLSKAEEMCKKSLAINEELGQKGVMAGGYSNLGMLYDFRGDLDKAEEMHKKSLAINEELGRKEGMAGDYNNLGILYTNHGDLDKAEEMYKKSIAVSRKLGQKGVMAIAYDNLGTMYKTRGDLDGAEKMYRKSLELFISIGSKPMIEKLESLITELKRGNG